MFVMVFMKRLVNVSDLKALSLFCKRSYRVTDLPLDKQFPGKNYNRFATRRVDNSFLASNPFVYGMPSKGRVNKPQQQVSVQATSRCSSLSSAFMPKIWKGMAKSHIKHYQKLTTASDPVISFFLQSKLAAHRIGNEQYKPSATTPLGKIDLFQSRSFTLNPNF